MKDKHQVKAKSFTTKQKNKERKEERNKEREREKGKV